MQEFELNTTIIRPEPTDTDIEEVVNEENVSFINQVQDKCANCPYCGDSGCYRCVDDEWHIDDW